MNNIDLGLGAIKNLIRLYGITATLIVYEAEARDLYGDVESLDCSEVSEKVLVSWPENAPRIGNLIHTEWEDGLPIDLFTLNITDAKEIIINNVHYAVVDKHAYVNRKREVIYLKYKIHKKRNRITV